ncbi:MAG: aldo/keto reductase [Actinomycetia bacterium]|jgi:aryl-alcohol dehydrogenase-like predicted oxidoreductase|nr:aldo/keto reductase [Actinomycetes bacterium]
MSDHLVPAPDTRPAARSGTFRLGGDLDVVRLGYGAMQLTGPGVWGPPADPDGAVAVLRRAVELGVTFVDTADAYGPGDCEDLIRTALHPYAGVVVATKAGLARTGPGRWHPLGRPEYLTQCVELSLRRLGVETIDLLQLHRIDDGVPLEDQVGALARLREAGKIRHIGLSEVTVEQLTAAQRVAPIVSVQNRYNLTERGSEPLLEHCTAQGIAFIPWFPFADGALARPDGPLGALARDSDRTAGQLALAWLLHRSPVVMPIPGTRSLAHLEENVAAADVTLDDAQRAALDALGSLGPLG